MAGVTKNGQHVETRKPEILTPFEDRHRDTICCSANVQLVVTREYQLDSEDKSLRTVIFKKGKIC